MERDETSESGRRQSTGIEDDPTNASVDDVGDDGDDDSDLDDTEDDSDEDDTDGDTDETAATAGIGSRH